MNKTIRRQLTLFVDPKDAGSIEQIRQEFNPGQFALIKSHVTLCREDEIENLEQVKWNLRSLTVTEIVIHFGKAARFDHGKGLFLPAATDNEQFQEVRRQILGGLHDNPRQQEPHITLMHPRNSTCTDDIFEKIENVALPTRLKFRKISLIEQKDGGPWITLEDFVFQDRT